MNERDTPDKAGSTQEDFGLTAGIKKVTVTKESIYAGFM